MKFGVFETWLKALYHKTRLQKRKILFLENVTSHADISLSHIKLLFFPAKITPIFKPLDQGIIHTIN